MNEKELVKIKNLNNIEGIYKNLYKGACVKIKNSQKTFQVIGLDPENQICWLREWPILSVENKTFALEINQISLQIVCSNNFSE
tara:strand:+ start:902 stop:1153 length:252 start_codon:yes stop_codon:yes gene_type:complete